LKQGNHHRGEGGGDQAHQQPGEPFFQGFSGAEVNAVVLGDTGEFIDIFGGFFLDDVDDVVHGDDPHQTVGVVHDGDGQQIVVGHNGGYFLLVRMRVHLVHIRLHDLFQAGFRVDQDDLFE